MNWGLYWDTGLGVAGGRKIHHQQMLQRYVWWDLLFLQSFWRAWLPKKVSALSTLLCLRRWGSENSSASSSVLIFFGPKWIKKYIEILAPKHLQMNGHIVHPIIQGGDLDGFQMDGFEICRSSSWRLWGDLRIWRSHWFLLWWYGTLGEKCQKSTKQ